MFYVTAAIVCCGIGSMKYFSRSLKVYGALCELWHMRWSSSGPTMEVTAANFEYRDLGSCALLPLRLILVYSCSLRYSAFQVAARVD